MIFWENVTISIVKVSVWDSACVFYLDMSPQYHSASCSDPPAPPSLALLPPPTPTEGGC